MTPERSRAEAAARIRCALELIENAQSQLSEACVKLSTVVGGVPVWRATDKLTDKVRSHWYRVDGFKQGGKFRLDDMTIEAIERRERFEGPAPAVSSADQLTAERSGDNQTATEGPSNVK